ncbi:hypothetical protein [Candidatus Berkiella aquae]|nr:hypothetical protein [Candidatus Berkiella aquae]MCS5712601.1 hypothetical protein [Candidatus Berkiella aquae]
MKCDLYPISQVTPLVNGFNEITIHAPSIASMALPGHYVILEEKHPCYLLATQTDAISLMTQQADILGMKEIHLSPLLGEPLAAPTQDAFYLLQAQEDGLNALIFYLKKYRRAFHGLILIEAEQFPFKPCPSRILIQGMPANVIAALPLFEDWGIPHRLASQNAQPGCFEGSVSELANIWLNVTTHTMPVKELLITPSPCLLPS